MTQLGDDQLAIQVTRETGCSNALIAVSFFGDGKEHIVAKFQSVYCLNKARVGVKSLRGSIH